MVGLRDPLYSKIDVYGPMHCPSMDVEGELQQKWTFLQLKGGSKAVCSIKTQTKISYYGPARQGWQKITPGQRMKPG